MNYLIITEPEVASSDGIFTINKVIEQIKNEFNKDLKAAGVIINKVQEKTNFHKLMKEVIKISWGEDVYIFNTLIPKAIAIPESEFESLSIGDYSPKSKAAIAFKELSKELIKNLVKEITRMALKTGADVFFLSYLYRCH